MLVLTGRQGITGLERDLLVVPVPPGGLGILNPTRIANKKFKASTEVTAPSWSLFVN